MDKLDLISVIIPIYNCEKYLDRCINSVINQTYKNLEVILVDDGSTDSSGLICDQYTKKDKRIKPYHTSNGGLSAARNYGIDKSHGKYIAFVDADDWIDPRMMETLFNNLVNYKADLSMCEAAFAYKNCTLVALRNKSRQEVFSTSDSIKKVFFNFRSGYSAWNKLYKKSLFNNIKFPPGKYFEDAWIMYEIFLKTNRIVCDNQQLYYYFQRPNSIMYSVSKKMAQDWFELHEKFSQDKDMKSYINEIAYSYLNICRDIKARMYFSHIDLKEKKQIINILDSGIHKFCLQKNVSLKIRRKANLVLKIPFYYVPKRYFAESNSNFYIFLKKIQYLFK